MASLRVLIRQADINGILLAERAIDEYLKSQDGTDRQTEALHVLGRELEPLSKSTSNQQADFIELLYDLIDSRLQGLMKGQQ